MQHFNHSMRKKNLVGIQLMGTSILMLLMVAHQSLAIAQNPADAEGKGKDPEATVAEAAPAKAKNPWSGSIFTFGNSFGAMGIIKSADLTWNPVYQWNFRLQPSYAVTDKITMKVKLGLGIEWTDSDDTTRYREPLFEDIWLDGIYGSLYTEPKTKIVFTPSLRLILPTSKTSNAASLWVGVSPGFSLNRGWDLPNKMNLAVSYAFRYTKNFNHYPTYQFDDPGVANCSINSGDMFCDQLMNTGVRVPSHEFANTISADWTITKPLHAAMFIGMYHKLLYSVTDAQIALAGGETITVSEDPGADVNKRVAMAYGLDVSYDLHELLSLSAGVATMSPQLAADSSYNYPFINRYTEFSLSATMPLDLAMEKVSKSWRRKN